MKLPPISVIVHGDGALRLIDGNHRLAIAREVGAPTILVHLLRGEKTGDEDLTYRHDAGRDVPELLLELRRGGATHARARAVLLLPRR